MKLIGSQTFDINLLKGALIINENGLESYIKDVQVDVANHQILIKLEDGSSIDWNTLKNWGIQFQ
tara:strand:- start:395 stop:589 length:195 start_codon:yes stop_codon:yes gene_type:complete